ncbi:MAG: hypothetical protein L3J67_11325 [Hyphomicrobiaceae bacterium]|nr:hypothetical protein [Hyphomicrobiaceae bacterium]
MADGYSVGQSWIYEAPRGFENSRIIIGAILTFASHEPVICASVTSAPMLDASGEVHPLTIPFLPFSKTAFDQTVLDLEGTKDVPEAFSENYKSWKRDAKGLGFINIPFKGLLRDMVEGLGEQQKNARQKTGDMACIKDH